MTLALIRPLRRIITKKFGGYRRFFVVLICTVAIIYTIKSLFYQRDSQVWDVSTMAVNKSIASHSLTSSSTSTTAAVIKEDVCEVKCLPDQVSFYISTGEKTLTSGEGPVICVNGQRYMSTELNNVGRGMNIVLYDTVRKVVKSTHVFDTFMDESPLLMFLKKRSQPNDLVFMATSDDAANQLKEAGRKWLKLYGGAQIEKLGFRDNFIFIGHRGLESGSALEFQSVKKKSKNDAVWAPKIEKAGCITYPLGNLLDMKDSMPAVLTWGDIKLGNHIPNCGLSKSCPEHSVAVAVDTGEANTRAPSICVDNNIVIGGNINDAGRGFNIVALQAGTLKPFKVSHMDTYTYDSTDLELLLESLEDGDIIIATISDDGSRKLSQSTRNQLNMMGSSQIQNLRFRDVWYFIGQKGMEGFSLMEQISFAGLDGAWPKPLAAKFCVPRILPFSEIMIDAEPKRNDRRREFCMKYEGYTEFCNPVKVDETLTAIAVSDGRLKGHKIFEVPIIIVPGMNHNAFVHTLETTLMQPGINVENVAVFWDEKLPEYGELTALFGFKNYSLESSSSYSDQLMKAVHMATLAYPSADHMIVLEEDVLLSPDFMPFMGDCLTTVNEDDTLAGAFAWNINGFESTSGNSSMVYRVQDFPGIGFLLKANLLKNMLVKFGSCCKNRAWLGWKLPIPGLEMLMPDVSRVYRTPFYGAEANSELARDLFLKPRKTHLEMNEVRVDLKTLKNEDYENFLKAQVVAAHVMKPLAISMCVMGKAFPPDLVDAPEGPIVIFYAQESAEDSHILVALCRCFGLVAVDQLQPKNMHNGLVRFYYHKHDIFLVGSLTPYFTVMTATDNILTSHHLKTSQEFVQSAFIKSPGSPDIEDKDFPGLEQERYVHPAHLLDTQRKNDSQDREEIKDGVARDSENGEKDPFDKIRQREAEFLESQLGGQGSEVKKAGFNGPVGKINSSTVISRDVGQH